MILSRSFARGRVRAKGTLLAPLVFAAACSGTASPTPPPNGTEGPGSSGPNAPGNANYDPISPLVDGQFPAPAFNLSGAPLYLRAVALTNLQWSRSVRDVLQLGTIPTQADSFLAAVGGFTLFPNNEKVLEISVTQNDQYRDAASELAAAHAATRADIERIAAGDDPDTFIANFGRRAFRRPLTDEEVARYRSAFDLGSELPGEEDVFVKGAGLVVEAMLQSPNFLYRTELSPDGAPLTGYELAARLSYWLLNTTPSETLLDMAATGQLDTPEGVLEVTRELLATPEAIEMAVDMFAEMFKFVRYQHIFKTLPEYNEEVSAEADEVSRRFFENVFTSGAGLREILTSTQGFVGPKLAPLYGLEPHTTVELEELGPERVGFFSQVPYLMLFANNNRSDAIHRGLFINYQVLCAELPTPNFTLPEPAPVKPGQSDRDYIDEQTGFGTCGATCHGAYINPLGYAFENFDGMGRLRATDAEKPVNTVSAYPFSTGPAAFSNAPELMQILVNGREAHSCFAKNIASYSLQRDIVPTDQPLLDQLADISMSAEGSMKNLILALVQTPSFRQRQGVSQ